MPGRMEFEFELGGSPEPTNRAAENTPMRILVLGNFSGCRGRREGGAELTSRRISKIDIDNFETTLKRLSPTVDLSFDDPSDRPPITIDIRNMDSFHPDDLYRDLEIFRLLQETRKSTDLPTTPTGTSDPEAKLPESDTDTLSRVLGNRPAGATEERPATRKARSDLSRFIHDIVAPHIQKDRSPRDDAVSQAVDQVMSEQMRAILHHPTFQRVESAWRGLYDLVSNVETGEELEIHLLDLSREELVADLLSSAQGIQSTGLYRLLVEGGVGTPGGQPWSLLVADFSFGDSAEDCLALASLGAIGSHAGGPLLAGANSSVLGCASIARTPDPQSWEQQDEETTVRWVSLRKSPVARWIGLILPRVLLRLPYGKGLEEIDPFEFEEITDPGDPESFLWGNGVFLGARLLATSFTARGWSMQPGDQLGIGSLPTYSYREDQESKMLPCAEAYLTETAAEAILAHGIMPLLSMKNQNAVRLYRFQSLASRPTALTGAWARS